MANAHFRAIRHTVIESRAFEYNNDYGLTWLPAEEDFDSRYEILTDCCRSRDGANFSMIR
ncbi:hypothetical protein [Paenibacillus sp. RC67]|uniref:hypothetical protein n=1 Tax=Paenibacillus sp. RC67 TaxID=3039392 RepID=UPI0024AE3410|nr:hypothetical protein [Paenibacillus sp. RC67]